MGWQSECLLARNCQFGLEKTTTSPMRSHLEIISHLLPAHLAAFVVFLALQKALWEGEHPFPLAHISTFSSSASSSALYWQAVVVWSCLHV